MHFLTVAQHYWHNPDLNAIQLFRKDIRAVLGVACQKVFFDDTHSGGWYHYGPFEMQRAGYYGNTDLQVGVTTGEAPPYVSRDKSGGKSQLIVTDRVFEGGYLTQVLTSLCAAAKGARLKSDDVVLNLSLLSLLLDFGLAHDHASLLNLPFLQSLAPAAGGGAVRFDARQLQVEVSNWLSEFDRKNSADAVTRAKVEGLIFELSYKFLVNKNLSSRPDGRAVAVPQLRPGVPPVRAAGEGVPLALPDQQKCRGATPGRVSNRAPIARPTHLLTTPPIHSSTGRLLQTFLRRRVPHRDPAGLLSRHLRLPRGHHHAVHLLRA